MPTGSARRAASAGLMIDVRDVVALERGRLVDAERADARAAQRGEVAAGAEVGAEVAGERADVRARRALDAHVDVDEAVAAVAARGARTPTR